MPDSRTSAVPLDPAADVAAKGQAVSGSERPAVVVDADPAREALTVSFYAYEAGGEPGAAPVAVAGLFALFALDSGKGDPPVPSWDRHEFVLSSGESQPLGVQDAPRPALRVTAALHLPADVDPSDYTFRVVAGEHSALGAC